MQMLNQRLVLTAALACLVSTYGCSSSGDTNDEAEVNQGGNNSVGGAGGSPSKDADTEAGTSVANDPCSVKHCGEGTCSIKDGKAVCACKEGFGNLNGTDGTCVACKEVRGSVDVSFPATRVSFTVLVAGQPINLPMYSSLHLEGNDQGFRASVRSQQDTNVPLGVYSTATLNYVLEMIPGYEKVAETFNLGPVEVKADTKALTVLLPRVVPIVARLPMELGVLSLVHESGTQFRLLKRTDRAPFGIETAAELKGQFSFSGRPGKYSIVHHRSRPDSSNLQFVREELERELVAVGSKGTNSKPGPLATFEVPAEGVTSPIEIDLPVQKVKVNLKVNDGSNPCDFCRVDFYSTSGKYVAILNSTTAERSVVLPRGTYVSYVSGLAEPRRPGTGTLPPQFIVLGGVHHIAEDQSVDLSVNLVKVSGKVLVNGMELVPKNNGSSSYGSVVTTPIDKADGVYASAHSQVGVGGNFVIWLPAKVAHSWTVSVNRDVTSSFSASAKMAALQADLTGFDFDLGTKKIEVTVTGPVGWAVGSAYVAKGNGVTTPIMDGRSEVTTGKHSILATVHEFPISSAMNHLFSHTVFFEAAVIDVNDTSTSFDVPLTGAKVSGKFALGTEVIPATSWRSFGTSVLDQSTTLKCKAEGNNPNGEPFNLWLPPGQYGVYSFQQDSYLGCYLVKAQ